MRQTWIYKPWADMLFILLPPFLILFLIVIGQPYIHTIERKYDFWTWIFLIVLIDVAHVYASLFKTYLNPKEFDRHRCRYLLVPLLCLGISLILCSISLQVFWSALAYVAVFHFIRQQYGIMRLYSRYEPQSRWNKRIDNAAIYNATIFPMIFWFMHTDRQFHWFMSDEFISIKPMHVLPVLQSLYFIILGVYICKTCFYFIKNNFINIPKNIFIAGTYLSWYFGIVYYNDDLIFTALNVVSHGVPYIALIYFKEIRPHAGVQYKWIGRLLSWKGIVCYLFILSALAFVEEYIWDISIWKEHFTFINHPPHHITILLLTSLLSVPQFTHYILDAYIWKSPRKTAA